MCGSTMLYMTELYTLKVIDCENESKPRIYTLPEEVDYQVQQIYEPQRLLGLIEDKVILI